MKRPPLNETSGLIGVILAFSFVFLFNSCRMGKMSKNTAFILGIVILLAVIGIGLL